MNTTATSTHRTVNVTVAPGETRTYRTSDLTALLTTLARGRYGATATIRSNGRGRFSVIKDIATGAEGAVVGRFRVTVA